MSNYNKIFGKYASKHLKKEEYLNPETKKQLNLLIKINKQGLITIDSQDGIIKQGKLPTNIKLWISLMKKYKNPRKKYNDKFRKGINLIQRAYLLGLLDKNLAEELVYHLNKTDKIAIINKIPVTYQVGISGHTQKIKHNRLPIYSALMCQSSITPEMIKEELEYAGIPNEIINKYSKKLKNLVMIKFIDPKPGRSATSKNGLFTTIYKELLKKK